MSFIAYICDNIKVINIILLFGILVLQAVIALIVCNYMYQGVLQNIRARISNLDKEIEGIKRQLSDQQLKRYAQEKEFDRVGQLPDRLQTLRQEVQELRARYRTDKPLILERFERLEEWVRSRESPLLDRIPQDMPPKATNWVNDTSRQSLIASRDSVDPEEVAFSLLDLIEPGGRSSPLARMAGLNDWLRKNHPSIAAEPIGALNQELWRLVVLTSDQKAGIVAPALDSIVGPQESLKWFEGGRYDGTQVLVRANVSALAKAVRDEETQPWRPRLKGKIDLT